MWKFKHNSIIAGIHMVDFSFAKKDAKRKLDFS